jgi:hypothetical protein
MASFSDYLVLERAERSLPLSFGEGEKSLPRAHITKDNFMWKYENGFLDKNDDGTRPLLGNGVRKLFPCDFFLKKVERLNSLPELGDTSLWEEPFSERGKRGMRRYPLIRDDGTKTYIG